MIANRESQFAGAYQTPVHPAVLRLLRLAAAESGLDVRAPRDAR